MIWTEVLGVCIALVVTVDLVASMVRAAREAQR